MPHNIDSFVETFVQAIHDETAAIFAGAGLSIPAGMVNWKDLLRDIAKEIGLDVDREDDLVTVAQFHVNERGGRHRINQALLNEFSKRAENTENHRLIASLPIRTFWTTNYDCIIEESLRNAGKRPDVKATVESLALTAPRRDAVVYKMHGDMSLPDKAVLTKDDYECYDSARHLFSMALQGDLVSKTFLFIGFSFSDPNLSYIFSRIRSLLGENRREHYCLLRRPQRTDFKSAAEYQYAAAKQDLQVRDLKRYGIIGLLVDDYSENTAVLRLIAGKYRMARVMISGSASHYDPWKPAEAHELIQNITSGLIQRGFGVVTGFGLGVGPFVVNGVLEGLERQGSRMIDDRVILRPFPSDIENPEERRRRWTAYRRDMISHAGAAIFLFGNRTSPAGDVIAAEGVEEEFRLAAERGLAVIPVGCTGGMAESLHNHLLADFATYYPKRGYKGLLEVLGKMGPPREVAGRVIELAEKIRSDNAFAVRQAGTQGA
jgi:hypothetical protein